MTWLWWPLSVVFTINPLIMRKLVPFICLMTCVTGLYSQQLGPTVISTSGNFFSNEYGMLSTTIGELAAIETYGNQYVILTQGFQQPVDMITGVAGPEINNDFAFDLYPNPSNGNFTIATRSNSHSNIEIKILDVLGREMYHDQVVHDAEVAIHQISLSPPQGVYFISLHVVPRNATERSENYLKKINILH